MPQGRSEDFFFGDEAVFGNANPAKHAMLEGGGATKLRKGGTLKRV